MNDGGDCRTAPATTGLLTSCVVIKEQTLKKCIQNLLSLVIKTGTFLTAFKITKLDPIATQFVSIVL